MKKIFGKYFINVFLLTISIGSVLRFSQVGLYRSIRDFELYSKNWDLNSWYTAGQIWNEGLNPYDYDLYQTRVKEMSGGLFSDDGYYYPPAATMLFGWLAALPLRTAFYTILGLNLLFLFIAFGMLIHLFSKFHPPGLMELTFFSLLLLTGIQFNLRWSQTSLVIVFMVGIAFQFAIRNKEWTAGFLLGIASLKPTFLPFYVAGYLAERRYRLVAASILSILILVFIPVIVSGRPGVETYSNWLESTFLVQTPTSMNNPSPFHMPSAELENLLPLVYRLANAQTRASTLAGWGILGLLAGCVGYKIYRSDTSLKNSFLAFAMVSSLTMLSTYHRHYDVFLMFPGILFLYMVASQKRQKGSWGWTIFIGLIMAVYLLPRDFNETITNLYPGLLDHYLFRIAAPIRAWANLAVLTGLLVQDLDNPLMGGLKGKAR